MSESTQPTPQPMTCTTPQTGGGNINVAFDHEEPNANPRLNTPTDIFCVTQPTTSSTSSIPLSSSTSSSPSPNSHDGPPSGGQSPQTIKSHRPNITIDIPGTVTRNRMLSSTPDNLDVISTITSQSLCTLSGIDIPSPLTTPKLQTTENLNAWLQEQEESSSGTRFDTPVTSFSLDEVVCMHAAGPSGIMTPVDDDAPKDVGDEVEEGKVLVREKKERPPTKRADSNMSACSSVLSEGRTCRICWTGEGKESLIQPCKCAGSSANVHVSCLKKWLQVTNQFKCEVCRQDYVTAKALKPISKWSWRCSKTRPLSQLEAILILLGIVTPPLLCGIVLCSQKVTEYLPQPQHAWKTATLLTLVIASTLMYVAALIYFCFKLSTVCSQWLQSNQRTVVRLGPVETVIENSPSAIEAREEDGITQHSDQDIFTIWTIT